MQGYSKDRAIYIIVHDRPTQHWLDNSFPRRGVGTVMSHSKGACPNGGEGAPPITAKGRGGVQIMLMWPQSVHYTADRVFDIVAQIG